MGYGFRNRKVYGASKVDGCLFCGKQATTKNSQEIPVCTAHTKAKLNDFKCACGDYLDLMHGKYGVFFRCMNCGPINMNKALEFNEVKDISGIKIEDIDKKSSEKKTKTGNGKTNAELPKSPPVKFKSKPEDGKRKADLHELDTLPRLEDL